MTLEEIIDELQRLGEIYGGEPNLAQGEMMVELLAPFEAWMVHEACLRHVKSSDWFPRPAQLYRLAQEVQAEYRAIPAMVTLLHVQAQELEDAFYRTGEVDGEAWRGLARQFESSDRPHRAAWCLERLRRFEAILTATADTDGADFELEAGGVVHV